MTLNRRNWLKLAASGTVLPGAGLLTLPRRLRMRIVPITALERAVVSRIVDLLIPTDETPGALRLGIDREVLADIEARRWDARWVAEAALWLDAQARADDGDDFLTLDDARQIALLQRMESAPEGGTPARVFRLLRHATMSAYYARPETWPSLGFDGPPQPAGFPGYAGPPVTPVA
ncbi:MAG: gluconate 2-dehydrogenase subunit 3 family protein [Burkholderiaceae bacterium]|nr:gluconate 2-dehydrogenase subunit 3 family protein [Burkholderiaceae bacterium]